MSDDLTKLRKTAKANTVFNQAALRLFVVRIKNQKGENSSQWKFRSHYLKAYWFAAC